MAGGGTFSAYDPVAFAEDAGAWVWTWPANAPVVSRATGAGAAVALNDDRDTFALSPPAGARAVLQITLSARSDGTDDLVVDPGIRVQLDGANTAGEGAEYALSTPPTGGPVRLTAPTADWGPSVVAEWDLPSFAPPANYDGMVIQTNAAGQGACRVRVTTIKFIARTIPTLDDFKADVSNLDVAVSTRATPADVPAAPDLSNLDVAVSTRLAAADYSAGGTQREVLRPAHVAGGHNGARASDAAFGGGGAYADADLSRTTYAVWRIPSLRPDQSVRLRASIQVRRSDGGAVRGGFPMHGTSTGELWVGRNLDGSGTSGATRLLRQQIVNNAVVQPAPESVAFADGDRVEDFNSILLVMRGPPSNLAARVYLWNLAVEVDGLRYVLDLARDNLDAAVSTRATPGDIPAGADLSALEGRLTAARAARLDNLDVAVSTRLRTADYVAPQPADQIADAVWDEDVALHNTADTMGGIMDNVRLRLPANIPADMTARLNVLRDRLPANLSDLIAELRKIGLADMTIANGVLTLRYEGAEIARFNARAEPSGGAGDFGGGRTRV